MCAHLRRPPTERCGLEAEMDSSASMEFASCLSTRVWDRAYPGDRSGLLLAEGDGGLWVGSTAISHLIAGKVTTYRAEDGLPEGLTLAMVRDHHGVLWAATTVGVAPL